MRVQVDFGDWSQQLEHVGYVEQQEDGVYVEFVAPDNTLYGATTLSGGQLVECYQQQVDASEESEESDSTSMYRVRSLFGQTDTVEASSKEDALSRSSVQQPEAVEVLTKYRLYYDSGYTETVWALSPEEAVTSSTIGEPVEGMHADDGWIDPSEWRNT